MIDLLVEGHNFRHDLFELIRVFFPEKQLNFVENRDESKDFLIESILVKNHNNLYAISRIYAKNKLIKEKKENIYDIHIDNYDLNSLIKLGIKKTIFDCLIALSDIDNPWGILTGIRPLKIVHRLIDSHLKESNILDILTKEYRINKSKVKLMLDISKIQRKYIYPVDKNRYSIYIGIPFCPTRCSYCSFPAFKIGRNYNIVEKYLQTLLYEIESIGDIMKGKKLNTIYIGGGTPTAIKAKDLDKIIKVLRKNFPKEVKEFTVEAGRPDTIDRDMLKMLKSHGVNRISINPQTMNQKTLDRIGRNHSVKSIVSAYNLAKEIGFDIINMDIILGLPRENIDDIRQSLVELKELNPENLTVHTLSIKKGSKLSKNNKVYSGLERNNIIEIFNLVEEFTKNNNLIPYYLYRQKQILGNLENVGYSKKDKESIYNIVMMEEKETIIGLGLGSVSKIYNNEKDTIKRIPNFKNLNDYNNRINDLIKRKKLILINN